METHIVKIRSIEPVTHDVRRFQLDKPKGYQFEPGQATEVAIHKDGWLDERRPFTFTSLNESDYLEFTIKIYDDHEGVTHQLGLLRPGDELILHDVWGTIRYKGEGTFIAGGAGVTPFIAIFRQLEKSGEVGNNRLIFSNKTERDIILKDEFERILGDQFINTLTQERSPKYDYGMIDTEYLRRQIDDYQQHFYICGPPPMVEAITKSLEELGAGKNVLVVEV